MKLALAVFLLLGQWGLLDSKPASHGETFALRLLRGTEVRPAPPVRPLEQELARRLTADFRWNHYEEVSQGTVNLLPGHEASVRLERSVQVHIRLLSSNTAAYAVVIDGKVRKTTRRRRDAGLWLTGIETAKTNAALFIAIEWAQPARRSGKD